jgi:hypothetical protein
MVAYRCILTWTSFPLDAGKAGERGARERIKPITPTFVLPRQGEGIRALSPSATGTALTPIFEGVAQNTKFRVLIAKFFVGFVRFVVRKY